MKILAIRGCNLASLAGEFEIDLAHGPLAGAGVFAIVGNTGAGKSTLLDALCVALFDRTPRLTNHSTVKVGRGEDERALLGAQDVRTLLRRGAVAGWAEVDFESGDARQYRARWSVRRARGQSDGTLQDQQLTLTAIPGGERLGGTKTETLKAIHARLGLSFDQFRRSALLAQGEFAAFLRADGKDRSELLERMTGTQIYSRLSIAAHVKAALAEQRLREGRAAALAIAVLDEPAEQAVQGELAGATAAAAAARRRHAAAEQLARWLAEAARRGEALAQARAEHAAARAAQVAAEPDRAELALRRRAEQLRPAWDAVERGERQVAAAVAELTAAGDAAAAAARRLDGVAERRARIAAVHVPVRAARIAAGIVERAVPAGRELGGTAEIVEHAVPAGRATGGVAAGERAVPAGPARIVVRGNGGWVAAVERLVAGGAADDAAWLAAHARLAPEVAAWPELDARFAQHAVLGEAIAAIERALAEHADARGRLDRAHKQVVGEVQAAVQRHDEARRKAAGYAQKRGLTLDAARRHEDEARTQLGEVDRLAAIAAAAREAAAACGEVERRRAELDAAAADDAAQRTRLAQGQRLAQAVRAEQERVVDELRRAAGYEHARAELASGEPCPLCGATEHPWRDRGALDGVIAAAAERLAATVAELEAVAAGLAAITARDRQRELEAARLAQLRTAALASAAAQVATWRDQLGALGELMLVDDPATPAAEALAADRQELARGKLEAARQTRSQTEAASKAAADAQAEVQLRQVELDQLAARRADLDRRSAELDATIGRARGEHASKLEHRAALAGELGAAMTRWLAALPGDAEPAAVANDGVHDELGAARARRASATRATDAKATTTGVVTQPRGAAGGPPRAPSGTRTSGRVDQGAGGEGSAASEGRAGTRAGRNPGGDDAGAPLEPDRGPGRTPLRPVADPAGAASGRGAAAERTASSGATGGSAAASARGGGSAWAPPGEVDAGLAVALVARLQATSPARRVPVTAGSSPLAIVRIAIAGVVEAWRERAERVADADAALAAAAAEIERDAREIDRAVAEHAARRDDAERRRGELARELSAAAARLEASRGDAGFAHDELRRLLSGDASRVDALSERLAALERAVDRTRAVMAERERGVAEHAAMRPRDDGEGDGDGHGDDGAAVAAAPDLAALAAAVTAAERRAAQLAAQLAADADARARRVAALADIAEAEHGAEVDRVLGDVIGSHDGKLFRSFAQSLTLDGLLAVANAHLEELAPRYQLERVPRHDLELQVIDRDLGAEVRSVQSLSGGESFLVALALALGLSSMSAHDVRVRTLLIDEGFGTLDPATLDSALSVLDALQATGRQVGVISHVPALVERVGAHVRVVQRGGGRSEVIVA